MSMTSNNYPANIPGTIAKTPVIVTKLTASGFSDTDLNADYFLDNTGKWYQSGLDIYIYNDAGTWHIFKTYGNTPFSLPGAYPLPVGQWTGTGAGIVFDPNQTDLIYAFISGDFIRLQSAIGKPIIFIGDGSQLTGISGGGGFSGENSGLVEPYKRF